MINSRYSPLSGGVDWERIYQDGRELLLSDGVDMVLASYLSVSAAKTRGVEGLAFGLELLLVALLGSAKDHGLSGDKVADNIHWAMGKLLPEIKLMVCTGSNMKEWFRSEYACEQLYEALRIRGVRQMDSLDAVGFQVFEKIDEFRPSSAELTQGLPERQHDSRRPLWLPLMLACVLGVVVGLLSMPLTQAPLTKVFPSLFASKQKPETVEVAPVSGWQRIEEVFAPQTVLDANEADYALQLGYLTELDRYHQRFTVARTQAANIERMLLKADAKDMKVIRSQAQGLAEYASGLSPLLGRIYYVDKLLEQQAIERAGQELAQADRLLKGMLIKRTLQFGRQQELQKALTRKVPIELAPFSTTTSENLPAEQ
ncbi:type VI secretion system ImpA family N-terminal domain-containing protein [Shewanella khirikhana]|uniref:ImpA N-terminal domain-containing protein n=1 Tax=Shewanella khirikhana TaxID=1965282 RepID=A0ABM7DPB6_9GAMM|nr:type VI secretion system ImpA family N-terminal domain-containing protein [Shewanella khirikhana]AZQ11511.1 hypothetical protein STH12_02433 [Shewanella khirikhana]